MNQPANTFYSDVERILHEMGHDVTMSADERDIVDDYENQEFGAKQCAERIAQSRT